MKKSEIADLINTYKIPIDELSRKSDVSMETILIVLADNNEPVSQKMLLRLKRSLNEYTIVNNSTQSIEEQLRFSRERIARLGDLSKSLRSFGGLESEETFGKQELLLLINQGAASDEEVADVLSDISILYRMQRGAGINFEIEGTTTLATLSHV